MDLLTINVYQHSHVPHDMSNEYTHSGSLSRNSYARMPFSTRLFTGLSLINQLIGIDV